MLKHTQRPWMKQTSGNSYDGAKRHAYDTVHNTRRWMKLRKLFLRENPLCIQCNKQGRITEATVCDHISAIKNGGDPWAWNNLQGLCRRCHTLKTNQEINGRKVKT